MSTFYPFADYEQTSGGVTTKHYSFGGTVVAVRSGAGGFSYLYQDGVNRTLLIISFAIKEVILG